MRKFMEVEVSFRIGGDALDPNAVTEALGITPDMAHRKGDLVNVDMGTGMLRGGPMRVGMWGLRSQMPRDIPLEEHLHGLLGLLKPKANTIRSLVESGCSADFFCGLFLKDYNDGVELPPETLADIAGLGAKLSLDIYDASYGESPQD